LDDKRIIELYFARIETAIDETSEKYGALFRRIAMNILEDPLDAEECENDTYLSLWNSIPPNNPANLSAYGAKIARNHALRRLEYQNAQKRNAVLMPMDELCAIADDSDSRPPEEIARLISEFLRGVSSDERRVFVRHYFALASLETVSAETGFSVGKIKSMLFRIRKRLRIYLNEEGISL